MTDTLDTSLSSRVFLLDVLDRTVKTFLQNIIVFLGAGVAITSVAWTSVLSSAGLAALVSFLLAVASATAITSGNPLIDILDRLARTGAGSLVAAIPVTGGFSDVKWSEAATIAAGAMLLSLVTSLASLNLGPAKNLPTLAPVVAAELPEHVNPTGSVNDVYGD